MSYLEIDFNRVDGYKKLSDNIKALFEKVYKKHNSCLGFKDKEQWEPTRVKEHSTYLEVHFKNGEWLHYALNGTWY